MFASEICTYVNFKYERLTMFCFYCGCLRHNDSFYHIRMSKGEEESVELGWDFSLRVQSRRVVAMHSVWLIEEGNGGLRVIFDTQAWEVTLGKEVEGVQGRN
ncbi:hypothetical protein Golob_002567 [Gossypium lobatum]|uniref:Zinc knuckle CX2CX4HX4C domain-containing protein n=1 Tax=Gossypium lobatum TaxID=34289 RepID=A0A7J8N5U6_9ROSI|nr:hypothetical protein [Gossypium lobatum]